jgi:hypothetical protein
MDNIWVFRFDPDLDPDPKIFVNTGPGVGKFKEGTKIELYRDIEIAYTHWRIDVHIIYIK